MSFWSGETLAKRLPQIIGPTQFKAGDIDCNAYTLRLGPEVYISPSRDEQASRSKTSLQPGAGVTVPPGQFAFLLTEESVAMPSDAMAFISMRSTYKLKGLVNVSGFHVDPGYAGRLIFAVFNASAGHIQLHRGDPCFLIWFASLDQKSELPYIKNTEGFTDLPSSIINPVGGKIESLAGLSSRIDGLDKRVNTYTAVALLVSGVVMTATLTQCREANRPSSPPVTVVVPSAPASATTPSSALPLAAAPSATAATPSDVRGAVPSGSTQPRAPSPPSGRQ